MKLDAANAAIAYADALQRARISPGAALGGVEKTPTAGAGFADMVKDVVEQSIQNLAVGEKAAVERLTSDSEIVDLVTAVTNAEITLQAVVAVRDRVIQAYQEIIQMPI